MENNYSNHPFLGNQTPAWREKWFALSAVHEEAYQAYIQNPSSMELWMKTVEPYRALVAHYNTRLNQESEACFLSCFR